MSQFVSDLWATSQRPLPNLWPRCDFDINERGEIDPSGNGKVLVANFSPNRTSPRIMVGGSFGSASGDVLNYETMYA